MLLTELAKGQKEAVAKALPHAGFGLFSQQRVGKSLTALAIADAHKPDVLFIVCPKKAVRVWREQLAEHLKIDWPCQKVILHYEALCKDPRDRAWYRRLLKKWALAGRKIMIIADEAHRAKRRGSLTSRMLRSLTKRSVWRLALTGTPIAQGREDAWAIFDFLMPGVLGATWEDFREDFLKYKEIEMRNKKTYPKLVGYRHIKKFDRIFHTYSYRETLREAQRAAGRRPYLVKRRVVDVTLLPDSRRIYNELLDDLKTEVRKQEISTPLVITLIQKLQQIAGGYIIHKKQLRDGKGLPILTKRGKPAFSTQVLPVGREKIVRLRQLVKSFDNRKKLVICVRYVHELNEVAKMLRRLGRTYTLVAGGHSFDGRFNTDTVILQIRSGEAIDLSASDTYIFYSWDYSYISHEQSRFRILSFTSGLVMYYYLIAEDTVDEDIYTALIKKMNLAQLVCDKYRKLDLAA